MKNFFKISVFPLLLVCFCLIVGQSFYLDKGHFNYAALYVVIGFPFGIGKMIFRNFPTRISKLIYDILVGAVAVKKVIYAFYYLVLIVALKREEKKYESNNM